MYFVKLNNKKVTKAAFKTGFSSYNDAKNALRKLLRSLDTYEGGFSKLGYSITKI